MDSKETSESLLHEHDSLYRRQDRPASVTRRYFLSVSVLVLLLYIAVLESINVGQGLYNSSADLRPWSPIASALRQDEYGPWTRKASKFIKGQNSEIASAWREVQRGLIIKVSSEELERAGSPVTNITVALKEGGYIGMVSVYHAIHCLDMFRRTFHADASQPTGLLDPVLHNDHCLDFLLDYVRCNADSTLYQLHYVPPEKLADGSLREDDEVVVTGQARRQCANWEAIDASATSRALRQSQWNYQPNPYRQQILGLANAALASGSDNY